MFLATFALQSVFAFCLVRFTLHSSAFTFFQARSSSDYAPYQVDCPSTPLVRSADGLSDEECAYVDARRPIASAALKRWLNQTDPAFSTDQSTYPTLALATSGGGLRAFLIGAGVHQAFDIRETGVRNPMQGLYQSLMYESALSGGSWLLGALMGNDWPTVTSLRDELWYQTLNATPFLPDQLGVLIPDADLVASLSGKRDAGFDPTIVDIFGRMAAFIGLKQPEGSVKQTLSAVRQASNYVQHKVPFPIITAVETLGSCIVSSAATQYEFTPIEFGSWDTERAAFAPTEYMGSLVAQDGTQRCVQGYDRLAYIEGTSGNVIAESCDPAKASGVSALQYYLNYSEAILAQAGHHPALRDAFAPYPNTFELQTDPSFGNFSELYLVDGGESGQTSPIWPFLYRTDVDVLIVEDSNAWPQTNGYPDGSDLYHTYVQAQQRGLSRMPSVPSNKTFVAKGYNQRPTFFGCEEPGALTIIYLPNREYVYASNTPTFQLAYPGLQVDAMLRNGQAVASYNQTDGFATCVGCAAMKKTGTVLPAVCSSCFAQYCATG